MVDKKAFRFKPDLFLKQVRNIENCTVNLWKNSKYLHISVDYYKITYYSSDKIVKHHNLIILIDFIIPNRGITGMYCNRS